LTVKENAPNNAEIPSDSQARLDELSQLSKPLVTFLKTNHSNPYVEVVVDMYGVRIIQTIAYTPIGKSAT